MKIGIECLEIMAHIGVLASEQERTQPLIIDIEIEGDFSSACSSDIMEDTVDYRELAAICKKMALEKHHYLLEHYASCVLDEIANRFKVKASIIVRKPSALEDASCAYVKLNR